MGIDLCGELVYYTADGGLCGRRLQWYYGGIKGNFAVFQTVAVDCLRVHPNTTLLFRAKFSAFTLETWESLRNGDGVFSRMYPCAGGLLWDITGRACAGNLLKAHVRLYCPLDESCSAGAWALMSLSTPRLHHEKRHPHRSLLPGLYHPRKCK